MSDPTIYILEPEFIDCARNSLTSEYPIIVNTQDSVKSTGNGKSGVQIINTTRYF